MRRFILLIAAAVSLAGCSEKAAGPSGGGGGFLFRVEVTDSAGEPVSGLRVSAHHMVSVSLFGPSAPRRPQGRSSSVVIPFTLAEESECEISILDLENSPVRTILEGVRPAGWHTVIWDGLDEGGLPVPGGVYRCRMSTGGRTFTELIDYYEPDPDRTVIGYTGEEGVILSEDQLLFPATYDLPELRWTGLYGDSLGTFTCLDSARLYLTDTLDSSWMRATIQVLKGVNAFCLEWDPVSPVPPDTDAGRSPEPVPAALSHRVIQPDSSTLGHPYPNPFN
ncbi:MAG: hypothetical protein GF417_10365 [Candidatus Latescibacteria bacterium]|nr:hypothetical protein [bacterium]MBD3424831.1 hypothetical protein [Candidatus Latescibacterota bacterium]